MTTACFLRFENCRFRIIREDGRKNNVFPSGYIEMEIQRAEVMMRDLMHFHGVHDYKFEWMRLRKRFRRAGQCNWEKRIISLQPKFVICNYPIIVKRTMLHEIAHALQPKQGHNKKWKAQAIKIGDDGGRCYGKEVKKR